MKDSKDKPRDFMTSGPKLKLIEAENELNGKLMEIDHEFRDFLASLSHDKHFALNKLKTFSPLDAVLDFHCEGLQSVAEVGKEQMMNDDNGMRRLLANMIGQCNPEALSESDLIQLSGINGRDVNTHL